MDESERKPIVLRRTRQNRTREETAGFILVIVTGGLAVLLGGFYLARHVGQPFDVSYSGPQFFTSAERQAQEVEEQKTRDTDVDGISDYDELYVLRTSPYLFDTDGDGLDDRTELEAGTDPTCAEDADCTSSTYVNPLADPEAPTLGFEDMVPEGSEAPEEINVDEFFDTVQVLPPDQIRDLLISSGADPDQVAQLTDDQIVELYLGVLADLESSGQLETSP